MTPHRSAVNVILGASGSGKTRLIESLLGRRPTAEHWAVLMNDLGVSAQRSAKLRRLQNVDVREISGCACCTGQLVLRTALVSMLRAQRPARVLIEASAAAEPNALLALVRDPELASVLRVGTVIATATTTQLLDVRYLNAPAYRAQLGAADTVVLSGEEAATDAERAAAHAALRRIVQAGTRLLDTACDVELGMLEESKPPPSQPSP